MQRLLRHLYVVVHTSIAYAIEPTPTITWIKGWIDPV